MWSCFRTSCRAFHVMTSQVRFRNVISLKTSHNSCVNLNTQTKNFLVPLYLLDTKRNRRRLKKSRFILNNSVSFFDCTVHWQELLQQKNNCALIFTRYYFSKRIKPSLFDDNGILIIDFVKIRRFNKIVLYTSYNNRRLRILVRRGSYTKKISLISPPGNFGMDFPLREAFKVFRNKVEHLEDAKNAFLFRIFKLLWDFLLRFNRRWKTSLVLAKS